MPWRWFNRPSTPTTVHLESCHPGYLNVSGIKLLMRTSGLGLKASKTIMDDFVNGASPTVDFGSRKNAEQFIRELADLHATATIVGGSNTEHP